MATFRLSFAPLLQPDTSGNAVWQAASVLDTNDLYPTNQVLIFKDTSTLIKSFGTFLIPANYVGTAKIVVRYKTTVTTGNVLWTLDYRAIAVGETGDPTTHQESLAGTATAVPATINLLADITFTLTSANLAANDTIYISLNRNGVGGTPDTAAASLQLIDAYLEYADV